MLTPQMRSTIERAAREEGLDPAYALAVAERESNFNAQAKASKSIYGLYQMSGPVRQQYGVGDSDDPEAQTRAFARYTRDLRADMEKRLGRPPTWEETYLGHHFGPSRGAKVSGGQIGEDAPVADVFTPRELGENPHFGKAGTMGALKNDITGDMSRRYAKYGGEPPAPATATAAADLSGYGEPLPDAKVGKAGREDAYSPQWAGLPQSSNLIDRRSESGPEATWPLHEDLEPRIEHEQQPASMAKALGSEDIQDEPRPQPGATLQWNQNLAPAPPPLPTTPNINPVNPNPPASSVPLPPWAQPPRQ